jgi:hypothetical protein
MPRRTAGAVRIRQGTGQVNALVHATYLPDDLEWKVVVVGAGGQLDERDRAQMPSD